MARSRLCAAIGMIVAVALITGCGGGEDVGNRAEMKGKVTFDGTPVAQGTLILFPVSGPGNKVSAPITDGAYEVPRAKGPDIGGKYRVQVFAFEPLPAPAGGAEADAEAASATRQIIPPQFNQQSTLELDVDSAEIEKDFTLSK